MHATTPLHSDTRAGLYVSTASGRGGVRGCDVGQPDRATAHTACIADCDADVDTLLWSCVVVGGRDGACW